MHSSHCVVDERNAQGERGLRMRFATALEIARGVLAQALRLSLCVSVALLVASCDDPPAPGADPAAIDVPAARAHLEASRIAQREERWGDAIEHLEAAIRIGPYKEGQRYTLGRMMLKHGSPDDVIAFFEETLSTDPKPQTSRYMLASALARKGQLDAAISHFSAAVDIDPAHEMSEHGWGLALERQGRLDEALRHFERATEILPDYAAAHRNCARVLRAVGRKEDAAKRIELARKSDPRTSRRFFYWGRALYRAGRYEAAAVELQKALGVDPDDTEAQRLLGAALRRGAEPYPGAPATGSTDEELEQLLAIGYVHWDEGAAVERLGVTLHDRDRTSGGVNLFTNDVDEVHLMDLQGVRVHTWRLPGKRNCQYAELLPGGNLLVVCVEESLAMLDSESRVLWETPLRVDHDFAVRNDGTYLVAHLSDPRPYRGRSVVFDEIAHVSEAGEVLDLEWWSTYEALDELRALHPPSPLDQPATEDAEKRRYDYYHLNTIELLPDTPLGRRDRRFRAGNILLCLRNAHLLVVLDQDDLGVVWHWGAETLDRPHMPTMLSSGHILIYDNGARRGFSRIVELDPETGRIAWEYVADPPAAFHSTLRGSNQRLPNGNTLICESERGHVFEVTPEGETVWEFWNPDIVDGRRKRIYRFHRVLPKSWPSVLPLASLSWLISGFIGSFLAVFTGTLQAIKANMELAVTKVIIPARFMVFSPIS